ncbi:MAG: ATP-grasp domain-containing protein [Deltaproteobacteria bacterium]|nr:ATP-grasp domain-containing protein [Deltaproteobacteria bacterium]
MPRRTEKDPGPARQTKHPVAVLYGAVSPQAGLADQDTVEQVRCISEALLGMGYPVVVLSMDLRLEVIRDRLTSVRPRLVFNLVESINGRDALLPLAPLLLDSLAIPYTGGSLVALVSTGNKLEAKRIMSLAGIPTPEHCLQGQEAPSQGSWIIKSVFEQASFGLDSDAVTRNPSQVPDLLARKKSSHRGEWFAEKYIPGREFNVSLLASAEGVEVLPLAEIRFHGFPKGRPRIVGYRAKWDTESPEYKGTVRCFDFSAEDQPLLGLLAGISRECWRVFGLTGYARVDFRVDEQGRPWVLEINSNPCLAPDAGFVAAASRAGLNYAGLIERIVKAATIKSSIKKPASSGHSAALEPQLADLSQSSDHVQYQENS